MRSESPGATVVSRFGSLQGTSGEVWTIWKSSPKASARLRRLISRFGPVHQQNTLLGRSGRIDNLEMEGIGCEIGLRAEAVLKLRKPPLRVVTEFQEELPLALRIDQDKLYDHMSRLVNLREIGRTDQFESNILRFVCDKCKVLQVERRAVGSGNPQRNLATVDAKRFDDIIIRGIVAAGSTREGESPGTGNLLLVLGRVCGEVSPPDVIGSTPAVTARTSSTIIREMIPYSPPAAGRKGIFIGLSNSCES